MQSVTLRAFMLGHGQRNGLHVHALFDAAVGELLQGAARARAAGIAYDIVDLDILKGDTRTPDFLAMNPSGRVPVLEVAPGRYLSESNAILWYIAGGSPLAPEDRIDRTTALQWMFFEQNSLEPYLGAAFFWLTLVKGGRELQVHALEDWMEKGYQAFGVMEKHLAAQRFLRGRPLHHRRHRALRLHARRARVRFRARCISRDPRLAQPHRRSARPRADGLASGRTDRGGGRMSYSGVAAGKVAAVVTSLEMFTRPQLRPAPAELQLSLRHVERPALDWFRQLYRQRRRGLALVLAAGNARCGACRNRPRPAGRSVRSDGGNGGGRAARTRLPCPERMRDQFLRCDGEIHRHRRGALADERGDRARMVAARRGESGSIPARSITRPRSCSTCAPASSPSPGRSRSSTIRGWRAFCRAAPRRTCR